MMSPPLLDAVPRFAKAVVSAVGNDEIMTK